MKTKILSIAVIGFALVGCAPSNISELATAMGKDNATVDVTLTTPWGTETFHRSMPVTATNTAVAVQPAATATISLPVVTTTTIAPSSSSTTNTISGTISK